MAVGGGADADAGGLLAMAVGDGAGADAGAATLVGSTAIELESGERN